MIGAVNPYVGPRPFRTGETLYGRDRESRELVDLLIAERIVLLYSPSGAGKSSLIQAAVVAQMGAEDYQVLPVCRPGADVDTRAGAGADNPFVARVIATCEDGRPAGEPPLEIPGTTLASYFSQRGWIRGDPRLKLLILDQFEEVLTSDQAEEAKIGFFRQLGYALRDQRIWALFAMREEYSAALDSYRHLLPTRLATRFRLDLLGLGAAKQAIRNPAETAGAPFEDAAVEGLLGELATVRERASDGTVRARRLTVVEPLYLQIVCRQLWEKLPADTRRITPGHLGLSEEPEAAGAGGGEVEQALEQYYAEVVKGVAVDTGVQERRIREWLERELIAPQDLRRQVPRGERETAGLPNPVVEALARHLLLRSDSRSGTLWYEVAHDRLVGMILLGNAKWCVQNLAPFQIGAVQWDLLRRAGAEDAANHKLLKGVDLVAAEHWRKQHPDEELSALDRDFLGQSRAAWAHGRRERWMRTALVVVPILSLIAVGWFWAYMAQQKVALEEQGKKEVEAHNRKLVGINQELTDQRAWERARALVSAASSEKWRGNDHELASLLAIQAYRFVARHGQKGDLGSKVEGILRSALQSQPFAYGMSLPDAADGTDEKRILLSRRPGLIAVQTGKRTINVRPGERSAVPPRTIDTRSDIIEAAFGPQDRTLVVLTESGLEIHPVASPNNIEGQAKPQSLPTESRPLGPFCFSQDERRVAIAMAGGGIQVWTLKPGPPARVDLEAGGQSVVTALACDVSDNRLGWGNRAGKVGILDSLDGKPTLLWTPANQFEDWPEPLRKTFEQRKADIDFGVIALHFLPRRQWLLAVYQQGPPRIYDLGGIGRSPLGAYLIPNTKSAAALAIAQDRGRATHRNVNMERFLTTDFDVEADPDERRIAVGGDRALVGLWDLAAASSDPDQLVPLQRIQDGQTVVYADYEEVPGLGAAARGVRFTRPSLQPPHAEDEHAGLWLAATDARANVRWWALSGLQGVGYRSFRTWKQEPEVIYALAFLPGLEEAGTGLGLAFGGTLDSGVLRIAEDDLTLQLIPAFKLPVRIRALATDADSRRLVVATGHNKSGEWQSGQYSWLLNLTDGQDRRARPLPDEPHTDGQWTALADRNGTLLLTAGWDGRAVLWRRTDDGNWRPETLVAPSAAPDKKSALLSASLDPAERDLAFGTFGGKVRLWRDDGSGFRELEPLLDGKIPVRALAYSPDGGYLVAGDDNGLLWRWAIHDGEYKPEKPVPAHQGAIYTAVFGTDGRLVTGGSDGRVYLWEKCSFDPRQRLRLEGPKSEVLAARLAPSGNLVAASDADGLIHLWELGLSKLIKRACAAMVRNLSWNEWKNYVSPNDYECTCPDLGPGTDVPHDKLAGDHHCANLPSP